MLNAIAKPFGKLMLFLYNLVGNYGVAVILFALAVKLIMLPFQLKSKKSMMRVSRLTPKLKELEKKFGHDQQKYQQEMAKLYKEEGANPMSGCLWSLLPFPILIALYNAIRYPLTIMMGVGEDLLVQGGALLQRLTATGWVSSGNQFYDQVSQSTWITEHFDQFASLNIPQLQRLNYSFLGLDLSKTPSLTFWNDPNWLPAFGLFLIPVLSALLSWLSMKAANAANPQTEQQQGSMKFMNMLMPLMSLWICFSMPAVMGVYWIAQSVFAMAQDMILNKVYTKQLDAEDAVRIEREKAKEAELEAKRQETERLKAEGATVENKNTSKKNKRAVAAQKEVERKAAEARAAKLAKKGVAEEEAPASQVGERRYARGRAYVPDRYTNPAEAEAKTMAAAEESAAHEETDAPEAQPESVETPALAEDTAVAAAEEPAAAEPAEQPEQAAEEPEEKSTGGEE